MPTQLLFEELPLAEAVVFGGWRHGDVLESAAPGLRALLEVAGGHEHHLDYSTALERGILVGSSAPAFGPVVAEMALALALSAMRGVSKADRDMRGRSERWLHDGNLRNRSLLSATVGFVGCGGISRSLQQMLEPFEVDLHGYDPPMPERDLLERGIRPSSLPDIFDHADVIFVLAAPTSTNRHLIDDALLARLSARQTIVLVSRASLVDFDALVHRAFVQGFGVGIDVYPQEPLAADHPLRDVETAVLVPHLAGALDSALHLIGTSVVTDLEDIMAGKTPSKLQYLTNDNLAGLVQTT